MKTGLTNKDQKPDRWQRSFSHQSYAADSQQHCGAGLEEES